MNELRRLGPNESRTAEAEMRELTFGHRTHGCFWHQVEKYLSFSSRYLHLAERPFSPMAEFVDFDLVDEHGSHAASEELVVAREVLDRDEVAEAVRVRVNLEAFKGESEGEYVVEGDFEAESKLVCGRCLEAFSFAEGSEFAVRYIPRAAASVDFEEDLEVDDGGLDIGYYDERKLAVTEVVAEQMQLAIPMKALCKSDCRGLCPECGTNLNEGSCSCERGATDDRWQGLEEIRKRLEK